MNTPEPKLLVHRRPGVLPAAATSLVIILFQVLVGTGESLAPEKTLTSASLARSTGISTASTATITRSSPLFGSASLSPTPSKVTLRAKTRRRYGSSDDAGDEYEREHDDIARQRSTDRPTQTLFGEEGPEVSPSQPKIVVLGATGRVGRQVVRQLLEMESMDMTIVAFVRNYDKAIRVLYDDIIVARSKKGGPKLQIVEGNLVPREELPGFSLDDEDEDSEEEQVWRETAGSAAQYFGTNVQEFDNRELLPDINESLEEALKGCTTVISCLGSFRPTNLWTDILARPFSRILRPDVSRWCSDPRHPYYVHYTSTRKTLSCVEREQRRREAVAAALAENDETNNTNNNVESGGGVPAEKVVSVPRIRFIRISDLACSQKPWHFVPLVTNVVQSVVFRYHEMAEQLLESSSLVETVVLRPGDLVDEERDVNTTSLQLSHTGCAPFPARVGREDVASLAIAAAMFQTPVYDIDEEEGYGDVDTPTGAKEDQPFHYTLACRWVGQELDPFPAQGVKADGAEDAQTALQRTLQVIEKNEKRKRLLESRRRRKQTLGALFDRTSATLQRRSKRLLRTQPHGLCAAIPVYIMLGLFARTLLQPIVKVLPGGQTWVLPALAQLNEWVLVTASLVMGKLMSLLPFLARRKQYISF